MTWGSYSGFSRAAVHIPFEIPLNICLFMLLVHLVPTLYSSLNCQLHYGMNQLYLDLFVRVTFALSL